MHLVKGLIVAGFGLIGATVGAEDIRIGPDVYGGGSESTLTQAASGDGFLAGERLHILAEIGGSAHLAGRTVRLDGPVGQNLYAAAYDVAINAPIGQSASLFGYRVDINDTINGALRVTAAELSINAPIGGAALVTGRDVVINAPMAGDVWITAENVSFGEAARIDGTLTLTADKVDDIVIDDRVIAADRITRIEADHGEGELQEMAETQIRHGIAGAIWAAVSSVLMVAVLAMVVAALAPQALASMRGHMLQRPLSVFGWGFAMLSALIGSAVVLALSVLGLLAVPVALIAAGLAVLAGYVIGAYSLGVAAFNLAGRGLPERFGERALRAGAGALALGLIALIPFLGWLIAGAVTLMGLGAITVHGCRPKLFANATDP